MQRPMNHATSPWIKTVSLSPPSLQDNTADAERLISALKTALQTDDPIQIDLDLIKKLPDILRQNNFSVRCILFKEPAHKLKIDQNKLQNCRSNILNLVNVL
ncbi:hypothetical protein D1AOALGA4SA_7496 [Olavius algarvensis Delta 1 endosymbiont]|nr:hypothetical protein D1AOALGA4SA_7496 [Olavius algarvensis Delta 1 endosymbiont]